MARYAAVAAAAAGGAGVVSSSTSGVVGEKAQRELFVGNLPMGVIASTMKEFFMAVMGQLSMGKPSPFGSPVVGFRLGGGLPNSGSWSCAHLRMLMLPWHSMACPSVA